MGANSLGTIGRLVIAAILFAAGTTASVLARTPLEEEKVCPYDGVKFRFVGQGSGTTLGQQLDLKKVGVITSPWPIAVCPTNGFVFYKSKFDDVELEKLRPFVLSDDYQATKDETPYFRAFWLIDRSGGAHSEASEKLLSATWEAHDERYIRYASELVRRLPRDIAAVDGAERRKYIVLQGELLRRLERFDEAAAHFRQWQSELGPTSTEGLIAAYELQLITKLDAEPHLVADAIKAGERDPAVWLWRRSPIPSNGKLTRTNAFRFASFNARPRVEWSAGGVALMGTEAPFTEHSWERRDTNLVRFDLAADTRTIIKTPVGWSSIARSKDGNTIWAIERVDERRNWRFLQIDGHSLAVRHMAPAVAWTSEFFQSYDQKSLLVHAKEGLAAFDIGRDGLRPLLSPLFSTDPDRWKVIGADPAGSRVVILHRKSIFIWDYGKGTFDLEIRPETWTSPLDGWGGRAFYSADGRHMIVATGLKYGEMYEITAWDLGSGQLVSRQEIEGRGCYLEASDSRRLFSVGCSKAVYLSKNGSTDQFVEVLRATDSSEIVEVAISPDTTKLATRSMDALVVFSIDHYP